VYVLESNCLLIEDEKRVAQVLVVGGADASKAAVFRNVATQFGKPSDEHLRDGVRAKVFNLLLLTLRIILKAWKSVPADAQQKLLTGGDVCMCSALCTNCTSHATPFSSCPQIPPPGMRCKAPSIRLIAPPLLLALLILLRKCPVIC